MQDLIHRLARMQKHWSKWARRRGITCYRVYDRDIPEYPFIADIYEDHLILTEVATQAFTVRRDVAKVRQAVREIFAEVFSIDTHKIHTKERVRRRAGEQYQKLSEGDAIVVRENGLKFHVYPDNWLDTGLFLDHRNLRATLQAQAESKSVLNLFCYTGSFSVNAAAGKAHTVHSVDLSARYLEVLQENFILNRENIDARIENRVFREDARAFLQTAKPAFYDIIVCDAPVFSRSRRQERDFDVLRDHPQLIRDCLRTLRPDGILYFSTNFRKFSIRVSADEIGAQLRNISAQTIPDDFRNKWIHTCYQIEHFAKE